MSKKRKRGSVNHKKRESKKDDLEKLVKYHLRGDYLNALRVANNIIKEKRDPNVICILAEMHLAGQGVEPNVAIAYQLFKEIAEDYDYPDAYNHLGLLYEYGNHVEESIDKAFDMYKKAEIHGSLEGKLNKMALIVKCPKLSSEISTSVALLHIKSEAHKGSMIAQYLYACFLLNDPELCNIHGRWGYFIPIVRRLRIKKNRKEALKHLINSSLQGNSAAHTLLGSEFGLKLSTYPTPR